MFRSYPYFLLQLVGLSKFINKWWVLIQGNRVTVYFCLLANADYYNPDAKPNMASLRLINEMELRIDRERLLGQGAFGVVYAGVWKNDRKTYPVAIKELQV